MEVIEDLRHHPHTIESAYIYMLDLHFQNSMYSRHTRVYNKMVNETNKSAYQNSVSGNR